MDKAERMWRQANLSGEERWSLKRHQARMWLLFVGIVLLALILLSVIVAVGVRSDNADPNLEKPKLLSPKVTQEGSKWDFSCIWHPAECVRASPTSGYAVDDSQSRN